MVGKPRVVRSKPTSGTQSGGEKLGRNPRDEGKSRTRLTIELEGKMAKLAAGEISVQDMDNEELARLQFKAADGTFRGRPPNNLPTMLVNLMRKELIDRLAEKRRGVLEEMQDVLIGVALHGEKDGDRIRAASAIIERELGKVPDKVEHSTGDKPFEVTMAKSFRMKRPGSES